MPWCAFADDGLQTSGNWHRSITISIWRFNDKIKGPTYRWVVWYIEKWSNWMKILQDTIYLGLIYNVVIYCFIIAKRIPYVYIHIWCIYTCACAHVFLQIPIDMIVFIHWAVTDLQVVCIGHTIVQYFGILRWKMINFTQNLGDDSKLGFFRTIGGCNKFAKPDLKGLPYGIRVEDNPQPSTPKYSMLHCHFR